MTTNKLKKCIECGEPHRNHIPNGEVSDRCFRCNFVLEVLNASITAINLFVPSGADFPKRKLTIIGYKIEKL